MEKVLTGMLKKNDEKPVPPKKTIITANLVHVIKSKGARTLFDLSTASSIASTAWKPIIQSFHQGLSRFLLLPRQI